MRARRSSLTLPDWHAALAADPFALVTQTPQWARALHESENTIDAGVRYDWPDGRWLAVPMAQTRDGTLGSWPLGWGIGGPLCPGGSADPDQVADVLADLAENSLHRGSVYLRPNPLTERPWRSGAREKAAPHPRLTQIIDLAGGFGAVWRDRFAGRVRTAVRKAQRSGITVACQPGENLVDDFDSLYRLSVDRWATQAGRPLLQARAEAQRKDPRRKFAAVARALQDSCRIWVASVDGEPAASIITLHHGQHAKYWRGAMNKDLAGPVRANNLLFSLAIEAACVENCRWFHLGDSHPGTPVTWFKNGLGATDFPTFGWWI